MISVYKIKPAFQKLLQPLLRALHKWGITANQLTLFAIFWSMGIGYALLHYITYPIILILVPLALLIRMALNALDGMMARQFDMQSRLGEVLNEFGDIISDLVIILSFLIIPGLNPALIIAFALLIVLNEFAGLLGKAMGGERRYDGPMGKSDRALTIGLFCLTWYFWPGLTSYVNYIFIVINILIIISTVIRLKKSL